MVVVLRSELGRQLGLAQKEHSRIINEEFGVNDWHKWTAEQRKLHDYRQGIERRLELATQALGALQLGDFEDKEF